MNRLTKNILSVLSLQEKKSFTFQVFLSLVISILDIAFIGLILFVIHVYTSREQPGAGFLPPGLSNPDSIALMRLATAFVN